MIQRMRQRWWVQWSLRKACVRSPAARSKIPVREEYKVQYVTALPLTPLLITTVTVVHHNKHELALYMKVNA